MTKLTDTDPDGIGVRHPAARNTMPLAALELVVGLALLAVAALYLRDALRLPASMNPADVGAGRFPLIVGGAAAATLSALALRAVLFMMRGDQRLAQIGRPGWVLVGMALLIAQAATFTTLGAGPVIAGSSLLLMLACGERRALHLLVSPVVLTAGIYLIFTYALGIQLP